MTYLELCVRVREESGVSGTGPASTINQTGVLAKIVGWVRDANNDIEKLKSEWRFLWRRALTVLVIGKQGYSPLELNVPELKSTQRIRVGEKILREIDWNEFLYRYELERGKGLPQVFAIAPDNSFWFYPAPDAAYSVTIDYFRKPIILVNDADVPQIPEEHHDCIVQKALMYYANFEEDQALYQLAAMRYEEKLSQLCSDQLPRMGFEPSVYMRGLC